MRPRKRFFLSSRRFCLAKEMAKEMAKVYLDEVAQAAEA